jgi:hypothetical protein
MNPMMPWYKENYRNQFKYWLSMVFSAHVKRGESMKSYTLGAKQAALQRKVDFILPEDPLVR